MIDRRSLLIGSAGLMMALAHAQARGPREIIASLGNEQRFSHEALLAAARELAKLPHQASPNELPAPFASLTYEQYVDIRARPNGFVFDGEDQNFRVEPLHRGFVFTHAVQIFIVDDGRVRRFVYDSDRFWLDRLQLPQRITDIGFSGLRIFGDPVENAKRQAAIIQGATFFRGTARGQSFGVAARALALRVAEARGEEIPNFHSLWIEQPAAGQHALTLHALITSPSLTGVWRATFRPSELTIVDAQLTLFARTTIDHLGIAPMSTMFLHGPIYRRNTDDYRPAVYNSEGLQMLRGGGEWVWRSISNRASLQVSAFVDENPRGFGFLLRDRRFEQFEDAEQRFETRPSLWIEPIGDWGPGAVQLIEIPTESQINDNIIAYWRPRAPLVAGQEATFAYRQFWCWSPPETPTLAIVSDVRSGRGTAQRRRRFIVDFQSDSFSTAGRIIELKPVLTIDRGIFVNLQLFPFPERKTCRVSFEIDPGSETLCEMRLVLEAGGNTVSETWLYRWTP